MGIFTYQGKLKRKPYVVFSIITALLCILLPVLFFAGCLMFAVFITGIKLNFSDFLVLMTGSLILSKTTEDPTGLSFMISRAVTLILCAFQTLATIRRVNDVTDCNMKISVLTGAGFILSVAITNAFNIVSVLITAILCLIPSKNTQN